jgi:hypothetical protein
MSKKAEEEQRKLRREILVTARQVSEFVNKRWQGVYTSYRVATISGDRTVWATTIHSSDGPKVHTIVNPDGTMEEL